MNHDIGNLIYGDDIVWFIKSRRIGTIIRIGQLRIPPPQILEWRQ